ncbi:MAG: response regulator receiver modulated diguanylate cyclase [Chloroflexi bacterium OLB14]|nr:MAG: response regulator receiver modulated diguanylate cyclase [Chloroflexi bacterium OLB14]
MNILVLENDSKELTVIRNALYGKKHHLLPVPTSDEAWECIQAGEARFVIASWDTSDVKQSNFVGRVRGSTLAQSVYILLITSKSEEDLLPQVDDMLQRPFKPMDLKNRIVIAERIISLTASLSLARQQLENQAVFDSLTGFINNAAFIRQSIGELERSRRSSLPLSLIILDVDNFQDINDTHGFPIGDAVLKVVAQVIREKSRPYDCIGRWSGDEFALALPGVIGADAEKIAERIIAGVRGTRIEVKKDAPLTLNVKVSAGIASLNRITTSTEIEPLIQQAQQAMFQAKEAGGNQVFLVYS